jgi:hypothetical protein
MAVIFLPVVLAVAVRLQIAPSKLLIPLSYATILGGTCTLIGTSTNLLVGQAVTKAGLPPLHLFDFALPGVIYALSGLAFLALAGLLPTRTSVPAVRPTRTCAVVTEIQFPDASPMVGRGFRESSGAAGPNAAHGHPRRETYPRRSSPPRTQFIRGGDVAAQGSRAPSTNCSRATASRCRPGAGRGAGRQGQSHDHGPAGGEPTRSSADPRRRGLLAPARQTRSSPCCAATSASAPEIRLRMGDTLLCV